MKVLLINPPVFHVIDPSLPEILQSEEDPMPPLGLMYLAGYLEKYSTHEVDILDCELEKINWEEIQNRVKEKDYEVIGITTMTFTLLSVLKTIKTIKVVKPGIKIVLGGPHAHIYPRETVSLESVDFVVLGEGEETFKELLDNMNQPKKLSAIKGLVFKMGEEIINNGIRPLIENLDSLPFPARQLLPYQKYKSSLGKNFPVTTMFTSRGCPYNCLFCDRPHWGKMFRARSADNVVKEMEECIKLGIKEIFIYDDTFTVDRQRVMDVCTGIKNKNLKIVWDIRTRVNAVDEELLIALKEAGCQRIHYGVEAGTQKILNVLRKGTNLEMIKNAFKLTRKVGIQILAYFMIGSPEETKEDIKKTIKLARDLKPDFANFGITTPYPATDLYVLGLQRGILKNDYWHEFAAHPTNDFKPPVWEENLKQQELIVLLKKAYQSFYFRPSYIIKLLSRISSWREFFTKAIMGMKLFRL